MNTTSDNRIPELDKHIKICNRTKKQIQNPDYKVQGPKNIEICHKLMDNINNDRYTLYI